MENIIGVPESDDVIGAHERCFMKNSYKYIYLEKISSQYDKIC